MNNTILRLAACAASVIFLGCARPDTSIPPPSPDVTLDIVGQRDLLLRAEREIRRLEAVRYGSTETPLGQLAESEIEIIAADRDALLDDITADDARGRGKHVLVDAANLEHALRWAVADMQAGTAAAEAIESPPPRTETNDRGDADFANLLEAHEGRW